MAWSQAARDAALAARRLKARGRMNSGGRGLGRALRGLPGNKPSENKITFDKRFVPGATYDGKGQRIDKIMKKVRVFGLTAKGKRLSSAQIMALKPHGQVINTPLSGPRYYNQKMIAALKRLHAAK